MFIGYIGTDSIGSLIKRFAKKAGEKMVEINNQRKAFLMLACRRELITDVRKPEIMVYDVIVGGELFTDYSDHPRKLVTLKPKLKSTGAGRYQLLSRWWIYRKQLGLERLLSKSQDAVALQQIKSVALFTTIDRVVISVRQSTVAAISGLHRALVMVGSSIRLTA